MRQNGSPDARDPARPDGQVYYTRVIGKVPVLGACFLSSGRERKSGSQRQIRLAVIPRTPFGDRAAKAIHVAATPLDSISSFPSYDRLHDCAILSHTRWRLRFMFLQCNAFLKIPWATRARATGSCPSMTSLSSLRVAQQIRRQSRIECISRNYKVRTRAFRDTALLWHNNQLIIKQVFFFFCFPFLD